MHPSSVTANSCTSRCFDDPSGLLNSEGLFSQPFNNQTKEGANIPRRDQSPRTLRNDKSSTEISPRNQSDSVAEKSASQIAPWINDGPPMLSTYEINASNFLSNGPDGLQTSPKSPRGTDRNVTNTSPSDLAYRRPDDRRPSAVSDTTVSSQNSTSKGSSHRNAPHKKLAGFFGDDGRQSPRGSENSIPKSLHRETTQTSQKGSIQSNYPDGRPLSPSSSRPRSPLPSSDVTPWLFQEFKVSSQKTRLDISMSVLRVPTLRFLLPRLKAI